MARSIPISPKYGLNPTIPICIFCKKPKNELALLGRIQKRDPDTGRAVRGSDIEAPKHMILDSQPCEECLKDFQKGVALIGVVDHPVYENVNPVKKTDTQTLYVNGDVIVMVADKAEQLFNMPLKPGDKLLVEAPIIKDMLDQIKENDNADA